MCNVITQEDKLRAYPQHFRVLIHVAAPGQVNYARQGIGYCPMGVEDKGYDLRDKMDGQGR